MTLGRIAQAAAARRAAAAQAAHQAQAAPTGTTSPQPYRAHDSAGVVPAGPSAGRPGQAISPFPASSPITWGRTDQGVDGTTTPGSQLLAMGSGTVTIGHDPAGFSDLSDPPHLVRRLLLRPLRADRHERADSLHRPADSAHTGTWGNSTTPGGFEIGAWPPGDMTAGAAIAAGSSACRVADGSGARYDSELAAAGVSSRADGA